MKRYKNYVGNWSTEREASTGRDETWTYHFLAVSSENGTGPLMVSFIYLFIYLFIYSLPTFRPGGIIVGGNLHV
ncbi:MAG: hypothetical protein MRQ08_06410, partial [Candidatus Midichloria mitochondrii]|nr:hypothetical protein [Candidatus Midichloria mitochondrii]